MRRALLLVATFVVAVAVADAGCTAFGPSRSDWAFSMVQITQLRAQGHAGSGVTVAIIDSGVDLTHPNLQGVSLSFWEDLVAGVATPYDDNGHGTAMASILVGRGSLAGGAPNVTLIVIKAITADGSGDDATVGQAISDASAHGADIISLSLGGGSTGFLRHLGSASLNAVNAATAQGVFVVGSAGNDGEEDDGNVASPGVARDAISVGAVDRNGVIAPFSSIGKNTLTSSNPNLKPEVVAPGVNITVAWKDRTTAMVSGTSPAAVFVSAALALILDMKPAYQRAGSTGIDAVKTALMNSAKPTGGQATPHDAHYGYGLVQAAAAAALLA